MRTQTAMDVEGEEGGRFIDFAVHPVNANTGDLSA